MAARYQRKSRQHTDAGLSDAGMNVKLILTVILSGLAVWFVAQNSAVVEIAFLFWNFSISTAVLIFLGLLAGFLLGWSLHSYLAYRKSVDEYNYLR